MQPSAAAPVRVAIIGAGEVGAKHAHAFKQLAPWAEVCGIADPAAARGQALAEACGTRAHADYRALLAERPDLAVVCVPHHLHLQVADDATQLGIHLLMEKPLAHTWEDAVAIVELAAQRQCQLAVGFVHRYRAEVQHAYQVLRQGHAGDPAMALDVFCTGGGSRVPGWVWEKRSAGGGALMYTGVHSVDRLRWLLGSEVKEVYARARTYSQAVDVEDGLSATLVFENGCVATLFENAPDYQVATRSWDCEVYGTRGRLRLRTGAYVDFSSDRVAYQLDVRHDDCFLSQARDLVEALRAGRSPWITGTDGLQAQAIVEAIYRSASSGQVEPVRHRFQSKSSANA